MKKAGIFLLITVILISLSGCFRLAWLPTFTMTVDDLGTNIADSLRYNGWDVPIPGFTAEKVTVGDREYTKYSSQISPYLFIFIVPDRYGNYSINLFENESSFTPENTYDKREKFIKIALALVYAVDPSLDPNEVLQEIQLEQYGFGITKVYNGTAYIATSSYLGYSSLLISKMRWPKEGLMGNLPACEAGALTSVDDSFGTIKMVVSEIAIEEYQAYISLLQLKGFNVKPTFITDCRYTAFNEKGISLSVIYLPWTMQMELYLSEK